MYGRHFGNVFIGVQPTFGYEGDPMRLLFSKSASPHHGFAAYYTYLEKIFKARACHGRPFRSCISFRLWIGVSLDSASAAAVLAQSRLSSRRLL